MNHIEEVEAIFEDLRRKLQERLPDLGRHIAIDSKAIPSYARHKSSKKEADGRRDLDADWGKKTYSGVDKDGRRWTKTEKWFGYKAHLAVDAQYELPLACRVTKASASDVVHGHGLIDEMEKEAPELLDRCEQCSADRGYDDTKLISRLWDDHEIMPVIDIRNMRPKDNQLWPLMGLENVVYDYKGGVFCCCPKTGEQRRMIYKGFEKRRGSLKFCCPVRRKGEVCAGCSSCPVNGSIRVKMSVDRRVFTPLARSTKKWDRAYRRRTSVERTNSRLDHPFGLGRHFIRGEKKTACASP